MAITAELQLILACLRSYFAPEPREPLPEAIDWDRFVRLARFHRMQGLVSKALRRLNLPAPPNADATLAADASEIAAENLRAAAECASLLRQFEQVQLPLLFVKGLTLGALAYGDSSLKSAADIDLLVEEESVGEADAMLRERGYRVVIPKDANEARLGEWHRHRKESVWRAPGSGLQFDLHSRLSDNPRLIPGIGVETVQQVAIGNGIVLPTLAPEELFAYLAVHGASSAWFRLKWISDFAALVSRYDTAELQRLYHRSQELGAGRAPAQALLLADRLFGSLDQAPALRSRLKASRQNRWLCAAAFRQVAGRAEPREPTAHALGTFTIHWTQLLVGRGASFKASELARQALNLVRQ